MLMFVAFVYVVDCFSHLTDEDFRVIEANKAATAILEFVSKWETGWWFQIFDFHPYLGKIPILTNIFQRG